LEITEINSPFEEIKREENEPEENKLEKEENKRKLQEQEREDFLKIWESEENEEKSPKEDVFPIEFKEEKPLELHDAPLELQEAPLGLQEAPLELQEEKIIKTKKELFVETNFESENMNQLNLCSSPKQTIFSPLTNDYSTLLKGEVMSPNIMSPSSNISASRRKNTYAMMSPSLNKKRKKAADRVQIREEEVKEFIPDLNLVLIF